MLYKTTPALLLTLLFSQPGLAGENYRKELNECYQTFNTQVDKISPLHKNSEGPVKPADTSLVQGCANALRDAARTVNSHVDLILRHVRDLDSGANQENYDCKLRQIFLSGLAKNLEASQDRELDVLVASTASTSRQFEPKVRMRFFKENYSQSTAKRLEKDPTLIMPVSLKEKHLEQKVRVSIHLCSTNELAAMKSAATRAQTKNIFKLQTIYDDGNVHEKTSGFERCIRDKVLKPLSAETERLQKIHDEVAARNLGVGCSGVAGDANKHLP